MFSELYQPINMQEHLNMTATVRQKNKQKSRRILTGCLFLHFQESWARLIVCNADKYKIVQ